MAGLQEGEAFGCPGCLGLGSAIPVLHVPVHPTSICDKGVNSYFQQGTNYCNSYVPEDFCIKR